MKVPPASDVNIIVTISGASDKTSPKAVPSGVAKANSTMNLRSYLKSEKDFWSAILIDIASANLWIKIESMRLRAEGKSDIKPKAKPSKIECILRAIIKTKGVKLHLLDFGTAISSLSSVTGSSTECLVRLMFPLSTNSSLYS